MGSKTHTKQGNCMCNGLRECELNTQGLAPKDPCFGTYKYYTTNYICIPAETSVTCHGGYSYLKCENSRIQINTANYGRTDKTTCSEGRPNEQLQNSNCYSPNALAPVSKSCNGLESCEVFATHTVFTDPCFGIYKYLAISYYCLPPGSSQVKSALLSILPHVQYIHTENRNCVTLRPPVHTDNTVEPKNLDQI
uniref:SUEL-type lectin domain-containing protein n=1 Tax=Cyprinus carpio TaxID=7962 RepID=A0A8C1VGK2_CYPCA